MPVFRNDPKSFFGRFSRKQRARKKRLKSAVNVRSETWAGARVYRRRAAYRWPVLTSKFSLIDSRFGGQISAAITKGLVNKSGRKFVVFDWGCGKGVAAKTLSKNKSLKVFGYGFEAYSSWLRPGKAELISTDKTLLVPYLKKRGVWVDLLYSFKGLNNLEVGELKHHLLELKKVIRVGGKIFFDSESSEHALVCADLKQMGFEVKVQSRHNGYYIELTRVK